MVHSGHHEGGEHAADEKVVGGQEWLAFDEGHQVVHEGVLLLRPRLLGDPPRVDDEHGVEVVAEVGDGGAHDVLHDLVGGRRGGVEDEDVEAGGGGRGGEDRGDGLAGDVQTHAGGQMEAVQEAVGGQEMAEGVEKSVEGGHGEEDLGDDGGEAEGQVAIDIEDRVHFDYVGRILHVEHNSKLEM